jgi:hypothetical protein
MTRAIGAASALGARGRTTCKQQVSDSNPLAGSQVSRDIYLSSALVRGTNDTDPGYRATESRVTEGHIE